MELLKVGIQLFQQLIAMLSFQALKSHVPDQLLVTTGHECLANTGLSGYTP